MFYIKLLQTPIKDSKNENIIFDDFNSQRDYFQLNNLVNYPKCNFSVNDGIESIATVYYTQIENKPQYGVYYTLNCNYAVVYDDNAVHNYEKYRFYFVTKIQHNAQLSQYIVYLHLDIIQTYYMYLHFDKCLINRCTFNRFTDENSRLYTRINFRKDSQLLLSDDINVSNYIVKEKFRIKPQQLIGNSSFGDFDDFNNFLLTNVKYWKYVFLNNIPDDRYINCIGNTRVSNNQLLSSLTKLSFDNSSTNITCLCAPVMNDANHSIYLTRKEVDENNKETFYQYKFDDIALDDYIKGVNLNGYILTEKISKMSPFVYEGFRDSKFYYSNNKLYIIDNFSYTEDNTRIYSTQRYNFLCMTPGGILSDNKLFMQISHTIPQSNVYICYNSDSYNIWTQDIKTYLSNISFNDIKQSYIDTKELLYKYRICLFDNNEKHYIKNSSIYGNTFKLKYYENLIPDISRYIYDIEVGENSIMYNYEKVMNFVLGSKDTYYLFEQSKYDTFIANNKNFYDSFNNIEVGKGTKALGIVKNFGLEVGAVASTVSHDSHNLTMVYFDPKDAVVAANELIACGGGMTAVKNGEVLNTLRLEVGGLMTKLDAEELTVEAAKMKEIERGMGITVPVNPLLRIVSLALPVVPYVKLTDLGMVDTTNQTMIPLFVE